MAHVERLLINLKILSRVKAFQKLNTKNGEHLVIEAGNWGLGSAYRWVRGDTRLNTLKRLNEIFDAVSDALRVQDMESDQRARMLRHVQESIPGLQNLRRTYEADVTITAHCDVLIDKVLTLLPESSDPGLEEDDLSATLHPES